MSKRTIDIDMATFKNNLMFYMKKADMTQKDLAKTAGLTQVSISRYMTGVRTPSVASLRKMAEALLIPVETLIADNPHSIPTIEQDILTTAKELSATLSDKEKSILIAAFAKALFQTS